VAALGGERGRLATRRQHGHLTALVEHASDEIGAWQEVLEVVEDKEDVPGGQEAHDRRPRWLARIDERAERLPDRRRDVVRVAERRQLDPHGAVAERLAHALGDLEGEPCLAHSARPDQRDEPGFRPGDERRERGEIALTPEQGAGRLRQPRHLLGRRGEIRRLLQDGLMQLA
jgi:hypothetical protein